MIEDKILKAIKAIGIFTFILYIVLIFTGIQEKGYTLFKFNFYTVLVLGSLISNSVLLFVLSRLKYKTTAVFWYSIFLISLIIWGFGEFTTRLSQTPQAAAFWGTLSPFGWAITPIAYFIFTLTYIKKDYFYKNILGIAALVLPTICLFFTGVATDLIVSHNPSDFTQKPWGYEHKVGPYFGISVLWGVIITIASLAFLFLHYRRQNRPGDKKQALLIFVSTAIPFIGG